MPTLVVDVPTPMAKSPGSRAADVADDVISNRSRSYRDRSIVALSAREQHFDERIRTICLVVIAAGVIYEAMKVLESIMIPFILAVTLKYLLLPVIDLFSCRNPPFNKCCCRLPRPLAVILAFFLCIWVLLLLGRIVSQSFEIFSQRAPQYRHRVETILDSIFTLLEDMQVTATDDAAEELNRLPGVELEAADANRTHTNYEEAQQQVLGVIQQMNMTNMILAILSKAAGLAEDLMYIILFLVFMLMHGEHEHDD